MNILSQLAKLEMNIFKSTGHAAKFCCADINCQMKIIWADNSEYFFESLQMSEI